LERAWSCEKRKHKRGRFKYKTFGVQKWQSATRKKLVDKRKVDFFSRVFCALNYGAKPLEVKICQYRFRCKKNDKLWIKILLRLKDKTRRQRTREKAAQLPWKHTGSQSNQIKKNYLPKSAHNSYQGSHIRLVY
jgi:hypothetical protein